MRLIDADALVEYFEGLARSLANARYFNSADAIKGAAEKVTAAPTIDAEPVRHAQWVDDDCSVCGCPIPTDDHLDAIFEEEVKYCYYCGAKMDGGADK